MRKMRAVIRYYYCDQFNFCDFGFFFPPPFLLMWLVILVPIVWILVKRNNFSCFNTSNDVFLRISICVLRIKRGLLCKRSFEIELVFYLMNYDFFDILGLFFCLFYLMWLDILAPIICITDGKKLFCVCKLYACFSIFNAAFIRGLMCVYI